MSDLTPSDDELLSSYLDGEATLDEVALIQADPELLARVQEFENATELLSTPVEALPQSEVDRLISNALAESATSDRITDLSAARASRMFQPQRMATIAAAFLLLAGAVGALFALNSDSGDEMSASTADSAEMADDYFGDDGDAMAGYDDGDDMADSVDAITEMADSGDDMAEAMPESDAMADYDDGDDTAEEAPADEGSADEAPEPSTTVAAVESEEESDGGAGRTSAYRLFSLEISESYETLAELIDHTTEQWRELVATGSTQTTVPQVVEDQEAAEQALTEVPCGHRLSTFIDSMDRTDGTGGISVGETTIADSLTTIVVVELSVDTAEILAASEPNCAIEQLAPLGP